MRRNVSQRRPDDAAPLNDYQVLQAFQVIGERLAGGAPAAPLHTLRERLAGELLGDAPRVAATLAPTFTVVTHTGRPASTVSGRDMVEGIKRQGETGVMLWVQLADLVADSNVVAGDGLLHTFRSDASTVTSFPLAFFIRYAVGGLMASEVAYMDVAATVTTSLPKETAPSIERLRSLLDFSAESDN
jgi:hypothetical protein